MNSISASVILAILVTLSLLISVRSAAEEKHRNGSYELVKGMEYLKSIENVNPDTANEFFRSRHKEKAADSDEKAKLISDINDESVDVFSLFKDYVLLGDSRALGFSHFGFLDYNRVFASGGDTILKSLDHIDRMKKLDPSYIFLCYGINDAGGSKWKTTEAYVEDVLKVINQLEREFPDAKIILSSIIWISDGANRNFPKWGRIYEFNPACRQMCLENGITYVDNDEICGTLKEDRLWSGDGIHLSKSFYKMWAKNLWLATLEDSES